MTFADDGRLRQQLRAPFPPNLITKVDKGFGKVDTLNHAVVTDRLNQAAPDWTYDLTRFVEVEGKDGMLHLLAVYGWMEIGGVRRYEVGEVERPSSYGDECKKAISDFIKRAAMRFGVGLDLWSKEDLQSSPEPRGSEARDGPIAPPASEPKQAAAPGMASPTVDLSQDITPGDAADSDTNPDSTSQGAVTDEGNGAGPDAPADGPASLPVGDGPADWKRAANRLTKIYKRTTSQTDTQQAVIATLKRRSVDVRKPAEVNQDLCDWALDELEKSVAVRP